MKNILLVLILFLAGGSNISGAATIVSFGPRETRMDGSIPYTVIGKYKAHFRVFNGRSVLDGPRVASVYLKIEAGSILSNCPWCDKLARSRRLLNAARYPSIIFKSDKIIQDNGGLKVKGVLEMHGVKRRMIFPFQARRSFDPAGKRTVLNLEGSWRIKRKDFNIIWNKYLDRGGVLVGDILTVDWAIKVIFQ